MLVDQLAGGVDYRKPLARRPGEVPADLLARLGESVVKPTKARG
jgi:hypothetical protein